MRNEMTAQRMTAAELFAVAEEWEAKTPAGRPIRLGDAIRRFEVSDPIAIVGGWAVTTYGLECLITYYPIQKSRITRRAAENWISHMRTKDWVDLGDFREALALALAVFGAERRDKKN